MIQKHLITIPKTARYFTKGKLTNQTKYIWLIIHGYAQTADSFLNCFESLGNEHFVVAPEGLNRFYSRGFSGSPVANWMTSLERENEILDYVNYLNLLVNSLQTTNYSQAKMIILGFSQGVSTQTRFLNATPIPFDYSVMVAGQIGVEFQEKLPLKLAQTKSIYLVGNQEHLLKPEPIKVHVELFKNTNCVFETFEGKHEINEHTLVAIHNWLIIN